MGERTHARGRLARQRRCRRRSGPRPRTRRGSSLRWHRLADAELEVRQGHGIVHGCARPVVGCLLVAGQHRRARPKDNAWLPSVASRLSYDPDHFEQRRARIYAAAPCGTRSKRASSMALSCASQGRALPMHYEALDACSMWREVAEFAPVRLGDRQREVTLLARAEPERRPVPRRTSPPPPHRRSPARRAAAREPGSDPPSRRSPARWRPSRPLPAHGGTPRR